MICAIWSVSRTHLSSTSLTKLWSLETAQMPITARCQMSLSPTSATETLKRDRSRSVTLRKTWRLSFSDEAPGMYSVSLRTPTTICDRLGQARPDRLQLVSFDHVAFLEVGEVLDADTALEPLLHF